MIRWQTDRWIESNTGGTDTQIDWYTERKYMQMNGGINRHSTWRLWLQSKNSIHISSWKIYAESEPAHFGNMNAQVSSRTRTMRTAPYIALRCLGTRGYSVVCYWNVKYSSWYNNVIYNSYKYTQSSVLARFGRVKLIL